MFSNTEEQTSLTKMAVNFLLNDPSTSGDRVQFTCTTCGRMFPVKGNLNKHIRTIHLRQRPFDCQKCGKSFAQKSVLQSHINTVHLKMRPYLCEFCGKGCSDKSNRKRHINAVHRREKRHTCDICFKKFSEKGSLKNHVSSVHLKLKPFACRQKGCTTKFGQRSHLSAHEKIHDRKRAPASVESGHAQSERTDVQNSV